MKLLFFVAVVALFSTGCASDGKTNTTGVSEICFNNMSHVMHKDGLDIGSERRTTCNGVIIR